MMARIFLLCVTMPLLVFGFASSSGADPGSVDKRDAVVDNAIGGMREGSRITGPDKYDAKTGVPKVPGTQLSPSMDTRVIAGAPGAGPSQATGLSAGGANEGIAGTGSDLGAGGSGTGGLGTGGVGGETGGGTTVNSGGSLIDVDANVDLGSGTVDAGVGLDTDNTNQILDADLTVDSGLPLETTESAISSGTDIGTEVDTSGGTIGGEADVGVEADVTGGTESDAVSDPADGLPVI
jgi:hypothetical protein